MPSDALARVTRALISVSDKTGLAELGRFLAERNVEILSTGGSAKALVQAGVTVTEVSAHTGFPEIMDGRVKTLHPKIHGGILGRRDLESHEKAMTEHGIDAIDLVVVNLYPFESTVLSGANFNTCIENIDIGGPALLRAAAKNHDFVAVVTDPADYQALINDMTQNDGATTATLRRRLAAAAFGHTAAYDAMIANWFEQQRGETFPRQFSTAGRLKQTLRYGENPHQSAAFYSGGLGGLAKRPGVASARQLQGKELSYNNLNDTDAAFELVAEFDRPAVAIIKHANPCGVALGETLGNAYRAALACDPVSAFGGIVAVNRPLDQDTATEIAKLFAEVVIAPEITEAAQALLKAKKNLRVLETGSLPDPDAPGMTLKSLSGGFLLQGRDNGRVHRESLKIVTKRQPSARELDDLVFAFQVAKHVKSNAIVYARDGATIGVGAGQMSRVDSSRIAAWKAREAGGDTAAEGSVAASDAFFPFADGLMAAIEAGATAVIQPGGSIRDDEVIAAADDAGIAMVFTGLRHFRH